MPTLLPMHVCACAYVFVCVRLCVRVRVCVPEQLYSYNNNSRRSWTLLAQLQPFNCNSHHRSIIPSLGLLIYYGLINTGTTTTTSNTTTTTRAGLIF